MKKEGTDSASFHERLTSNEPQVVVSSDRTFGLVFTAFFALIGLFPLVRGHQARWWAVGVSLACLVLALVMPKVLHPLNLLWAKLAVVLHMIVSPVMLALVFFLAFTPTGFLMRLFGLDPMRLRRKPGTETYWITKTPPGPPPESMVNQF